MLGTFYSIKGLVALLKEVIITGLENVILSFDDSPVSCQWGKWEPWGRCSKSCGPGGSRKRERQILNSGSGDDCNDEEKMEEESCFVKICAGDKSFPDTRSFFNT